MVPSWKVVHVLGARVPEAVVAKDYSVIELTGKACCRSQARWARADDENVEKWRGRHCAMFFAGGCLLVRESWLVADFIE